MTGLQKNKSLLELNTFGLNVWTRYYSAFGSKEELGEICESREFKENESMILGGGSNVLFTRDYNGVLLKNEVLGIELLREDEDHYWIKVGAGENWHNFVLKAVANGWAGVENLSLIPGNSGAAPMQNIGAYGVEIKDFLVQVEAYHFPTGEVHVIDREACKLGYRESIFKNEVKGEYAILSILLKLNKTPEFRISYGAIREELDRMNISELNIKDISEAVIRIRRSKLPDPKVLGNAGSFFKNPVIPASEFEKLKDKYPDMPNYPANGDIKLAAGWLIEQAGWKGKKVGNCGVHDRQALVLVNHGGASGEEIYQLSEDILQDIKNKFGIELNREVNII